MIATRDPVFNGSGVAKARLLSEAM